MDMIKIGRAPDMNNLSESDIRWMMAEAELYVSAITVPVTFRFKVMDKSLILVLEPI